MSNISGQQIEIINDAQSRELLFSKVKQIDEFIHRFNFNVSKFSPESLNIYSREEQIPMLFAREYKYSNEQKVNNFTKAALYSPPMSFYTSKWFAKVNCEANYKGRKVKMDLIMQVELGENGGSSWIISGTKAPFLFLNQECDDPEKMIPPSNNEVGFVGLTRVFNDKENFAAYYPQDFEADYLSVLLYAVKTGDLKFIQALSVEYYFADVEDWIFKVKYFNREEKNSGWLISEANFVPENDKQNYLKNNLNLLR